MLFLGFVGVSENKIKPNKPANHRKIKDTACNHNLLLSSVWLNAVETEEIKSSGELNSIQRKRTRASTKQITK